MCEYSQYVKRENGLFTYKTKRRGRIPAVSVVKAMMEDYGNPSSLHNKGKEAEDYIKDAREKIAKALKAQMRRDG